MKNPLQSKYGWSQIEPTSWMFVDEDVETMLSSRQHKVRRKCSNQIDGHQGQHPCQQKHRQVSILCFSIPNKCYFQPVYRLINLLKLEVSDTANKNLKKPIVLIVSIQFGSVCLFLPLTVCFSLSLSVCFSVCLCLLHSFLITNWINTIESTTIDYDQQQAVKHKLYSHNRPIQFANQMIKST